VEIGADLHGCEKWKAAFKVNYDINKTKDGFYGMPLHSQLFLGAKLSESVYNRFVFTLDKEITEKVSVE